MVTGSDTGVGVSTMIFAGGVGVGRWNAIFSSLAIVSARARGSSGSGDEEGGETGLWTSSTLFNCPFPLVRANGREYSLEATRGAEGVVGLCTDVSK